MAEPNSFGCKLPNCEYPRGGPCFEGLKPEECPHRTASAELIPAEVLASAGGITPLKTLPSDDDITFGSGFPLLLREVRVVTEENDARLVVIMGEKDAGKTTLLAEIHYQFLTGPFAGFLFAGSRTLVGFEEKCFYSRIESGGDDDDTERTKHVDVRVMHLVVRDEQLHDPPIYLLFADVSGERFRQIRGSREEAEEFAPLLKRADRIALLVDGERLADIKTRQIATTHPKTLLRGLLEAGALGRDSIVDIVLAKWDAVIAAKVEAVAAGLEEGLLRDFGSQVQEMNAHRISARRKHNVPITEGMGLGELLQVWTRKRIPTANEMPTAVALFGQRAFFRFGA